jgi:hypothetical protein
MSNSKYEGLVDKYNSVPVHMLPDSVWILSNEVYEELMTGKDGFDRPLLRTGEQLGGHLALNDNKDSIFLLGKPVFTIEDSIGRDGMYFGIPPENTYGLLRATITKLGHHMGILFTEEVNA